MNHLEKKFNYFSLARFVIPSMLMMLYLSMYSIVDGFFVSRFVNTTALGALNIIWPLCSIFLAIGVMFGTGGSAYIAKRLGEGKKEEAKSDFTFLLFFGLMVFIVLITLSYLFLPQIVYLLGGRNEQLNLGVDYLKVLLAFYPFYFFQVAFQSLFITASKPKLGLLLTTIAGLANIFFDYLFMGIIPMGIKGAALGTGISYSIPAIFGLLYFFFNKKGTLQITKFKADFKMIKQSITNGMSEMVSNLAVSVTTIIINYQCLILYAEHGEDGVAAMTAVYYFQFLISAIIYGYSGGVAPIISYKYGNQDQKELHKVTKYSLLNIAGISLVCFILSLILIKPVAIIFAGDNKYVYDLMLDNFIWFAPSFIFSGIAIFASSFFTALNDGVTSAIISFARTLFFLVISLLVFPIIMGHIGIWFAPTFAEACGFIVSIYFIIKLKKKFKY